MSGLREESMLSRVLTDALPGLATIGVLPRLCKRSC